MALQRIAIIVVNLHLLGRTDPVKISAMGLEYGERGRNRTCDPCIKSALLYRLSYALSQFQSNIFSARY
jgi:hypothetical protein